jgi:membrane protein YdbS with pleckstrin-like domain
MKTPRAIGLGVLVWLLIFIEISITMIGLKLSETIVWMIHYIFLIPIVVFCAWLYYKSRDKVNGFLLGVIMLVVGIILDMIITVPLFGNMDYLTYFSNLYMLPGFLESVVIVGLYDILRKKR